jgi:transcriptional regulator with XRE-family HTH domain
VSAELGTRIREARQSKGWTLGYLANLTQLSKSHLSDTENGKRNPSASTLLALCRALDVSADWLLGIEVGPLPKELTNVEKALRDTLQENADLRTWKAKAEHKLRLLLEQLGVEAHVAHSDDTGR